MPIIPNKIKELNTYINKYTMLKHIKLLLYTYGQLIDLSWKYLCMEAFSFHKINVTHYV